MAGFRVSHELRTLWCACALYTPFSRPFLTRNSPTWAACVRGSVSLPPPATRKGVFTDTFLRWVRWPPHPARRACGPALPQLQQPSGTVCARGAGPQYAVLRSPGRVVEMELPGPSQGVLLQRHGLQTRHVTGASWGLSRVPCEGRCSSWGNPLAGPPARGRLRHS